MPSTRMWGEAMGGRVTQGIEGWAGYAVLASVAFYRPLSFLAANPWEISSPLRPLLFGCVLLSAGLVSFVIINRLAQRPTASAVVVCLGMLILIGWRTPALPFLLAGLCVALVLAARFPNSPTHTLTAYVLVAVLGVAPIVHLVSSHIASSDPYPMVELAPRTEVDATGAVEDVLVVVVDQYPAIGLAKEWFGHDGGTEHQALVDMGYVLVEYAWSASSFTLNAIPSLLELQQVASPGTQTRGNHSSLLAVARGDNLVSASLQSAGFTYHHVEGGWDGDKCGDVDICYPAPMYDELASELLEPSIFGLWLEASEGSYLRSSTLRAAETLHSLRDEFDDGEHDYVYSHLLLPHDPYVVDSNCDLLPEANSIGRVREQLACTDRLLAGIASIADEDTAVLITGDHGTGVLNQLGVHPADWTDAQVAERFGVFLAYRFPSGCEDPDSSRALLVMRALMTCAVHIDLPIDSGVSLAGVDDPVSIGEDRFDAIMAAVETGTLTLDGTVSEPLTVAVDSPEVAGLQIERPIGDVPARASAPMATSSGLPR